MPGWYVHMEAAKLAAQRLRSGTVPPGLNFTPARAQELGEIAHTWRNYYAIGSLGPDLFYLLPDFKGDTGATLLATIRWVLDTWATIDDTFIGPWEEWMGPVGANDADLAAQLTGGLSSQLGQALDSLAKAIQNAFLTLLTRFGDIFGLLTSGVPQGFGETAFYWSDMFHYRSTYGFARQLFANASANATAATTAGDDTALKDAQAGQAFALGWMTHCAVDVTGHAMTNEKCGGPYRLHWQRHHLIENHFDSYCYDETHGGDACYGEFGTSGLHFRIAFRGGTHAPYVGRMDQPAYDYFAGFPAYTLSKTAQGAFQRDQHFDMDPGTLPDHLVELLLSTMHDVYGDGAPLVLTHDPAFNDGGTGRPNADALNEMWEIVFRYLRLVSTDGFHPSRPEPPSVVNEHPFPLPPGSGPADDDSRGADLDDDDDFSLLDLFLAILAFIIWIGQVIVWLVTVLPGLIIDVLTFPAREFIYYTVVVPAYSLFMASRRLLVMEGFLMPKPEEVDIGLVTLGISSGSPLSALAADLDDPSGFAMAGIAFDEQSGRVSATTAFEADRAYPRATVADPLPFVAQFGIDTSSLRPFLDEQPSHWIAPWRYPEHDMNGDRVGFEASLTHAGPWQQGQSARALLHDRAGNADAIDALEAARNPGETAEACQAFFTQDKHMGAPVDYSVYLVGRLTGDDASKPVPDFNLDSDRGYAYHCWDWERHEPQADGGVADVWLCSPPIVSGPAENTRYQYEQPCTVPEQYDPDDDVNRPREYDPMRHLNVRYLDPGSVPTPCAAHDREVSTADIDQAGMTPTGGEK